jgi:hypothetical protein
LRKFVIEISTIQSQVAAFLADYGEPLTVARGGSGGTATAYVGYCVNAARGGSLLQDSQEAYFDDNELAGLIQPVLSVYLDGTCSGTNNPPQILDTFSRDGRPYTVRKVGLHRIGSTVVAYVVFAD